MILYFEKINVVYFFLIYNIHNNKFISYYLKYNKFILVKNYKSARIYNYIIKKIHTGIINK